MHEIDKAFVRLLGNCKTVDDVQRIAFSGNIIERKIARFILSADYHSKSDNGWKTLKNGVHIKVKNGIIQNGPNEMVKKRMYNLENKLTNRKENSKIHLSRIKLDLTTFSEKDLEKQGTKSIIRGIKSLEKKVEKHQKKIEHPELYDKSWDEKDEVRKKGLLNHWEKEIKTLRKSIERREEELRKRE